MRCFWPPQEHLPNQQKIQCWILLIFQERLLRVLFHENRPSQSSKSQWQNTYQKAKRKKKSFCHIKLGKSKKSSQKDGIFIRWFRACWIFRWHSIRTCIINPFPASYITYVWRCRKYSPNNNTLSNQNSLKLIAKTQPHNKIFAMRTKVVTYK